MNKNFVLDADDREIIITYLVEDYKKHQINEHYFKMPDVSWEAHVEQYGEEPTPDFWDYDQTELIEVFERFFAPNAKPEDWFKIEHIDLKQSVIITFGKEFSSYHWKTLNNLKSLPLVKHISRFLTLMEGTFFHQKEKIQLAKLLEWLRYNKIDGANESFIENIVEKRNDVVDWKAEYETSQKQVEALKLELSNLEKYKPSNKSSETRKHNTCVKIIAGIALEKYKYNKTKAKNSAVTNIQNALLNQGVSVDEGTILEKIRTGIELIEADVNSTLHPNSV